MILHLREGEPIVARMFSPLTGYAVTEIVLTCEDAYAMSQVQSLQLARYMQESLCCRFVPPISKESELYGFESVC